MRYSRRNSLDYSNISNVDGINNYELLVIFIILRAAKDYRAALWKIRANPMNKKAIGEALEVESFFRSGWYQKMTTVDGEYIIRKIREEIPGGIR